jgi:hypothetical protein
MWNSVAPGWEANAEFVDEHLAAATDALLDAAEITEGDAVLELAAGPGGAGLRAAQRVGPEGSIVLSDDAAEMVAVAARRAIGHPRADRPARDERRSPSLTPRRGPDRLLWLCANRVRAGSGGLKHHLDFGVPTGRAPGVCSATCETLTHAAKEASARSVPRRPVFVHSRRLVTPCNTPPCI